MNQGFGIHVASDTDSNRDGVPVGTRSRTSNVRMNAVSPLSRLLLTAGLMMFGAAASAALVSTSQTVTFNSGQESIWGPGQGTSFRRSGTFRTSSSGDNARVGYSARASTGTARVDYSGALGLSYDDTVTLGQNATLDLGFSGGSSRLRSDFGAGFDTTYGLTVGGINISGCIFCLDYDTDIDRRFASRLGTAASGSDSFEVASVEFGPNVIVGSATVGATADVSHSASFVANSINGTLEAINQTTGAMRNLDFSLGAGGLSLDLALDELGLWDISFSPLSLANRLTSSFGIDLNLFAGAHVGVFCGDRSTNSDNGFGCIADEGISKNVGSVSLGSVSRALGFNQVALNPFSINVVAAAAAVPEPGVISLLGLGLLALAMIRKRV